LKTIYPAFFTKTDTVVLIEVPDLEILIEGTDMVDAVEMARDAIELKCISMEDDGTEIPMPSEITSLDVNKGTFANEGQTIISLVDIDTDEYRRKIDTKTVRKNVTIPSWLNYEAERAGINVSRVLQEALMNKLNVKQKF
jgi:predicted RNase H-like HicB family nuclease